jgi:hypothetical protein
MTSILKSTSILFFLLLLNNSSLLAQYYDMPGGTVEICKGFFRDSGGDAPYSNDEVIETTFCSVSEDLQMSIFFDFIQVEAGYDYLYVYDGPDSSYPLIYTFNGSYADVDICATSQCLTFKFVSDYSITPAGWFGTITCGYCEPTFIMEEGTIESCNGIFQDPGGNGNYEIDTIINTTFCSDNQEPITVIFNEVALELNYDFLNIYDGPTTDDELLAVLNGNMQNVEVCSTGECLTFNFISDYSITAAGWEANISCGACTQFIDMPADTIETCEAIFRDSGGAGNYTNNEDLITTICSPTEGENLMAHFDFIQIELNYDYLYVHDGPNVNSPIIAIYNGSYEDVEICSSSQCLTFNFKSDNSVLQAGWSANISCGACNYLPEEVISIQNGRINTCDALFLDSGGHENYTNNELNVQTICTTTQPASIQVDFLWIEIEPNYDYLAVFDGPTNSGDMLAQFSGSFQNQSFCSDSGCLTFQFTSDFSVTPAGWLAFVSCEDDCGNVVTSVESAGEPMENVLLFPNPVSDQLFIKMNDNLPSVSVAIFNLSGQEVINQTLTSNLEGIVVSQLSPGVYIARIMEGTNWTYQKFIKQ